VVCATTNPESHIHAAAAVASTAATPQVTNSPPDIFAATITRTRPITIAAISTGNATSSRRSPPVDR